MVTFETVLDWVEGRLDEQAGEQVRLAVAADPELAALAQWIRTFQRAAAPLRLEAPPPAVRESLIQRFAARNPPPPSPVQRVRAVITFDSALSAPVLGIRAGAPRGTRHLVLESDQADVALDLYPEGQAVRVEGQLLPRADAASGAGVVELRRGEDLLAVVQADETGVFALPPVPRGEARLTAVLQTVHLSADLTIDV